MKIRCGGYCWRPCPPERWIILLLLIVCTFALSTLSAQTGLDAKNISAIPVAQKAKWTQPWWMERHRAKVDRVRRGAVDLLMIGDSITHGWEAAGSNIWDRYYKHRRTVNLGFNGDRTEHVLWRLMNGELNGISPKLTVLMIGTNNSGRGRSPEDTAKGIKRIVQELRWQCSRTKVLLLAIFPTGATPNNRVCLLNERVNRIIAGYDDGKNVFFLDINEVFMDDNKILIKSIMPDLLHPNAEGYRRWAERMEPFVSKLLGDQEIKPIKRWENPVGRGDGNPCPWTESVGLTAASAPVDANGLIQFYSFRVASRATVLSPDVAGFFENKPSIQKKTYAI